LDVLGVDAGVVMRNCLITSLSLSLSLSLSAIIILNLSRGRLALKFMATLAIKRKSIDILL
jgi:hypothetical protein